MYGKDFGGPERTFDASGFSFHVPAVFSFLIIILHSYQQLSNSSNQTPPISYLQFIDSNSHALIYINIKNLFKEN